MSEAGMTLEPDSEEEPATALPLVPAYFAPESDADQTLLSHHVEEKDELESLHKHEGWHLKAWFEANAEREACHPLPR